LINPEDSTRRHKYRSSNHATVDQGSGAPIDGQGGKQSVHIEAMRRNCQDFEQLAMSFGEGLCGHFGSHGVASFPGAPWRSHR
jgi:hypothetical protein